VQDSRLGRSPPPQSQCILRTVAGEETAGTARAKGTAGTNGKTTAPKKLRRKAPPPIGAATATSPLAPTADDCSAGSVV
jgi:hypothetical protein